jgi:hypothetical protein
MLNSTFSSISRYTRFNRFLSLEPLLEEIITKNKINSILDVGVSTGETSFDLYNFIPKNIQLYISDPFSYLFVRKILFFNLYYDFNKKFVGLTIFGVPIKNSYRYNILDLFANIILRLFRNFKLQNTTNRDFLLCDVILELLELGKVKWVDFDLFKPTDLQRKFDIIRVMNVLNKGLFSDQEFNYALNNLTNILNDNGFLFLGRSFSDNPNKFKVSVYSLINGKLKLNYELNGGADFKENIRL